ncbi:hypothetical protein FRC07_000548 [Ceratobasidium sp. 392]|nr:hypothetical protein FRC07_000548 [Ceratobasidium sp. 392]
MEETARELREELKVVSGEENTDEVAARLTSTYQPRAGGTCMRVVTAVSKALDDASDSGSSGKSRLANALANASSFIEDLSCSEEIAKDAISRLKDVHQQSLQVWCNRSAEDALKIYQPALEASPSTDVNISLILRPSNHLMSALRLLTSSVGSLGLTLEQLRAKEATRRLLAAFRDLLAAGLPVEHAADQVVWDLMFVREMYQASRKEAGSEYTKEKDTSSHMINSHLEKNSEETQRLVVTSVKNQLYRSQLLLSTLLDAGVAQTVKQTQSRAQNTSLPLGVPPSEPDFRPALELVKPGQRFGMLPIAAVAHK